MVEIKKLIVLPNENGIYIDCSVLDMPYFKDIYLDQIIIDTEDTFNVLGPSKVPVYKYKVKGNVKNIQHTVKGLEILTENLSNKLFFVYIITKGIFAADTPCGMDSHANLCVVFDKTTIHKKAIPLIPVDTKCSCTVPKKFIDFILSYKSFILNLKAKNYPLAIKHWKKFNNNRINTKTNGCKCNR